MLRMVPREAVSYNELAQPLADALDNAVRGQDDWVSGVRVGSLSQKAETICQLNEAARIEDKL